jgi:hypothetical protein
LPRDTDPVVRKEQKEIFRSSTVLQVFTAYVQTENTLYS